ncbi:purine-cytosine permease family protein [Ktedonospora formicarum]|uniref:Cytosine permease n=1 Tax=Ktedonospora formicarum TaxID=2778364 RepID=A0A8J3HX26_9CHLR|nr:cytosine permease [Ktedonospora formicarum]GHO42183.1 cytosine permease [Ktedonospora formicarum]
MEAGNISEVATKPETPTGFEVTGIERIGADERHHTQLADTMWLWWSANSVIATVALGALSFYSGLGFWGSVAIIVIFNVLAALLVAFLSTLGPKTGLAQMPLSRFAFGFQGAKLPAPFNALTGIGWNAVNSAIGASLLTAWSGGAIPFWVGLIILVVATVLVSTFGYFIVHSFERFAWIPMFLLFGYVFFAGLGHYRIDLPATVTGLPLFASVLTFGGTVFGYAVGWASYAADYTRHQPENTSSKKVFSYSFIGILGANVVLEILGTLLITSLASNATLPDTGKLIVDVLGNGPIASMVILLLAISIISNNVPTDYSFALSIQAVGVRVKRWVLTIVGALCYLAVALLVQSNLNLNLQGFLLLMAYWLGAWSAIVIIEHLLRKGQYPLNDYADAKKLPLGIAAVVALIVGLAVAALGINQASVIGFEGPLSHLLADADIGFPLAIVTALVIYYPLRRWEMRSKGR